ncbi:MAG: MBL fold metallo-hydrolase, partial [Thermodesulfobacteriota bacterium]
MNSMTQFYSRNKIKLAISFAFYLLFLFASCSLQHKKERPETFLSPISLKEHCQQMIGPPRVERISEHVWLAIGYDLANTVLIHTKEGNIIVDPAMSPERARLIKNAFLAYAPPGPIKVIIYTHSHLDHTGGASVWEEKEMQIWATASFREHFFKQYSLFLPTEMMRARRQFG